jgi:phospholipid-translocating ATPase
MELKKIHVGTVSYANEAMDEVTSFIRQAFAGNSLTTPSTVFGTQAGQAAAPRTRREIGSRVRDLVLALALCHNVTPTGEEEEDGRKVTNYQASSPDEIAIVRYTEDVGLKVAYRDRQTIVLESTESKQVVVRVNILDIFPFTSDSKRMGIIVQFEQSENILETGLTKRLRTWLARDCERWSLDASTFPCSNIKSLLASSSRPRSPFNHEMSAWPRL